MDELLAPADKPTKNRPRSRLLWMAIGFIVIGSLIATIAFIILAQPVSEENLWTLMAIPVLIGGGCLTFVGVIVLIVNGALRGIRQTEDVKNEGE